MRPDPTTPRRPATFVSLAALAWLSVVSPSAPRGEGVARASVAGVAVGAGVLLAAVLTALLLRRTRRPRPLSRVLLVGSVKRADDRRGTP